MPYGQYEPVRCLENAATYAVLHVAPEAKSRVRSRLSKQRFVVLGADYRSSRTRQTLTQPLLRPRQIPGLNGVKHYLISTGATLPPTEPSPSDIVLVCLSGELEVGCRNEGVKDFGTLKTGGRIIMGPGIKFTLKNTAPDGRPASVLQFNFSSGKPIR
jgi:hypothetical protein